MAPPAIFKSISIEQLRRFERRCRKDTVRNSMSGRVDPCLNLSSQTSDADRRTECGGECRAIMLSAALLLCSAGNFVAKLADNFATKARSRVEGSNPLCSAIQSVAFTYVFEMAGNPRRTRRFSARRAPERKLRPDDPDLGGVLSARRKVGSLEDPEAYEQKARNRLPTSPRFGP